MLRDRRRFNLAYLAALAAGCAVLTYAPAGLGAAAKPAANDPQWGAMLMGLLGGLALFLFGMEQMADGLKAAAGTKMKTLLGKLTKNRVAAALTGATVTAVIQSSSVTAVLVVGFVSAGLMTLAQSIGVVMGANVGTTITAQIVAFKVQKAALLIIAGGFATAFLSSNERVKQYGSIVMGLGLVFFGMSIMSDGMAPLRSYEPFIDLMAKMESPVMGILVAAAFTALVQSSSATTGIVIAMASQGLISLPAGIALIFGSNIGTCVTAILAAIGKSTEAVRVAVVHVVFNVAGVIIWLAFIPQLAAAVTELSPVRAELFGTERLAAEVPRQIANAHTLFNVANTLFFILFTGQMARFVEWLVPQRVKEEKIIIEPKYLDPELVDTPALALDRVRMELGHLGEIILAMLGQIREAFLSRQHEELDAVARLDDRADILHSAILDYLNKVMKNEMSGETNELVLRYVRASEDLERIGDVIETELVEIGHLAIDEGIEPSDTTRHIMDTLYIEIREALSDAVKSISEDDQIAAQNVINMKAEINSQVDDVRRFQAERLLPRKGYALGGTRVENDIVDGFKRIYSLSKRIAKLVLPTVLHEGGV